MNIVLFERGEIAEPLPRSDLRACHVLDVLRRKPGDTFDAGLIDGPRGKATLTAVKAESIALTFAWGAPPAPLSPINLLVGLPRPQTARKILQEATSLGVCAMHFVITGRTEPSYAASTLWTSGEWRRHLVAGAAQAFCTRLPVVSFGLGLGEAIAGLPPYAARVALDNYESPASLAVALKPSASENSSSQMAPPVVLALGSERGWTTAERDLLRANGFCLAHLGPRVLRTETACVASVAVVKSTLGWF